jgi:hypothetical protein
MEGPRRRSAPAPLNRHQLRGKVPHGYTAIGRSLEDSRPQRRCQPEGRALVYRTPCLLKFATWVVPLGGRSPRRSAGPGCRRTRRDVQSGSLAQLAGGGRSRQSAGTAGRPTPETATSSHEPHGPLRHRPSASGHKKAAIRTRRLAAKTRSEPASKNRRSEPFAVRASSGPSEGVRRRVAQTATRLRLGRGSHCGIRVDRQRVGAERGIASETRLGVGVVGRADVPPFGVHDDQ